MKIAVKRIYETTAKQDGFRVLVDHLWLRGVPKGTARIDLWLRDIEPSTALRRWFDHDPAKWKGFCTPYHAELCKKPDLLAQVKRHAKDGPVTLLYSAKDERHNQAVALAALLMKSPSRRSRA